MTLDFPGTRKLEHYGKLGRSLYHPQVDELPLPSANISAQLYFPPSSMHLHNYIVNLEGNIREFCRIDRHSHAAHPMHTRPVLIQLFHASSTTRRSYSAGARTWAGEPQRPAPAPAVD